MKTIKPRIARRIVTALLLVSTTVGCMSPAGGRAAVDRRSANIDDQIEWMKSTGGSYGSHGAPSFARGSGRFYSVNSSAANN